MRLDVIEPETPWYAEQGGLSFTCTQCGNCCTGGPGYVWVTREEVRRLAEHLKTTPEAVVEKYCRTIDGKLSLKERRNKGLYDCVFLKEIRVTGADGKATSKRVCAVYAVRPLQCRTWPFWPENVSSEANWKRSTRRCPGAGKGRLYTPEQVERIRDAADWPVDPPSSGQAPVLP